MVTTIFSIVATILITWFFAKWQMRKNKITHFSINSYDIGKGLRDEFPDFKIHYGDENLVQNVKVFKGGFMNVGHNDVTSFNGETDIKLSLPSGCIVKAVNIIPSNDDLHVVANRAESELNVINFGISSDILKSNEYFEYTAIIETGKEERNLYDRLNFRHRIPNTAKIHNTYVGQVNRYRELRKGKYLSLGSLVLLVLCGVYSIIVQNAQFGVYRCDTGEESYLYINPSSELHISTNRIAPFIDSEAITINDLKDNYSIIPETAFSWLHPNLLEIILTLICVVYIYYSIWWKNRHIVNVISDNEKKH